MHDEIKACITTPATYTIEQCVYDWLGSLATLEEGTVENYQGQAETGIYPMIGQARLKEFTA